MYIITINAMALVKFATNTIVCCWLGGMEVNSENLLALPFFRRRSANLLPWAGISLHPTAAWVSQKYQHLQH